ncbi:MAG: PepSY domain-containing protein [Phenylobacterium sp.]|uniref:PepSY-associated TM helix domain-containing protein n=1 Tax=Phenylobacterium sp. TaxID=1871053 RepID=UPI001A3AD6D1|nr:PepSY-associated TM helix domain-containing protein [Phenylobacterium sp.]MBL8555489.1 PepSY domain-containing protein [Phenylobacterium sp.]
MTLLSRLRRLWLDVHLWIGAGLVVVLIPLSVTGAILVWHDPIDRALHAERYATTGPTASRPVQAYADAAQEAFGTEAQLTQVRLPQQAGDPVVAVGRIRGEPGPGGRPRTMNAWIDPPTGRVLGTGEIARQATQVMHRIHGSLMLPSSGGPGPALGRQIVGWLGWAMFVSCVTGLWLWWPRHGGFRKGLRWHRGASTLFNLHHLIGFWVCAPLAVLSLTGVYISFPQTSRAVFGLPPPPPRAAGPGRFAPPISAPKLTVGEAVAKAQAEAPGAAVTEVNAPTSGREPVWRVSLTAPGAARPKTVQVVDATGAVKAARGRGPGGGEGAGRVKDEVSPLMRGIHDGADMGIAWQVVIFVAGIAPAVLGITGVVMWLRRRARRRAIRHGLEAA